MKLINTESLYKLVNIDEVQISPDGARVAFVRTAVDRGSNEYVRSIWNKNLNTPDLPAQPFTAGRRDVQPRWTRDGARLGFISARNGEPAVYAIALVGGEAHSVATHANGVSAFEWSPDSRRIAFTASVRSDERRREDEAAQTSGDEADPALASADDDRQAAWQDDRQDAWDKKREKELREHEDSLRFDPRIVREFPYRTGTAFLSDRWSHVYVMDAPVSFADETPRKSARLTDGDTHYTQPAWSADGLSLLAVCSRYPQQSKIEYRYDLVTIPAPAGGDKREVTDVLSTDHSHNHPLISPDGKWLAFQRHNDDRREFRNTTLAIMPAAGGAVIDLTANLDRSVNDFVWGRDSDYLYFTQTRDGAVNLFRVSVADGAIETLTTAAQEINCFDVDNHGRVVYAASTPSDPSALFLREVDGRIVPLYQPNAGFVADHTVCAVEPIQYQSDEFSIEGWIILPPGFDPDAGKKYSLALEIHGGPSAMWGAASRSMWHEFQTIANRGYVVFYCNPRGSGGYGESFLGANCGDWGDGPMRDIFKGLDLVVARGYVDSERLVVTGGSYGGYLTAWIVGRDGRFKAAVAQRGVYNLISMRGVTDIPAFNDRETGATPWEDINQLWRLSPLSLAPNVHTPLLLEHSEQDYRVPISQAEELYLALRTFNRTVELIRWPREGHELSRSGEPKHRVERIARIVDWFDKYTKQNES